MNVARTLLTAVLPLALMSGCASSTRIAEREATFLSLADRANPPSEITATFKQDLCSDYFSYIKFAINNPHNEWLTMNDVSLFFPYSQNREDFDVVVGDRLAAWIDSTTARQRVEQYNDAVSGALTMVVGAALINEGNDNARKMGAGLIGARLISDGVSAHQGLQSEVSAPTSTDQNQHILSGDILIPPGSARQYWLLLHASDDAPLMGYISLRYTDPDGEEHHAVVPLDNWRQCGWQQERKQMLWEWGREQEMGRKTDYNGRTSYNPTAILPVVEAKYQKQQEAASTLD